MKAAKKPKNLHSKKSASAPAPRAKTPERPVGMEFPDRASLLKALAVLQEHGEPYDLAGSYTAVARRPAADRLARLGIRFKRLKIIHMLDLPVEQQRRLRTGFAPEEARCRMRQAVESRFDISRISSATSKV